MLALTVYYDAMCAGLIFSNLIAEKTAVLYIVLGVLLAIGNILALVYVVILCKKRKLQNYMHPNEVLTDMVARVKEFDEIAKVVYNKPVEKPIVEFNPPDDEDGEEGEEPVRRYDATFAEDEEEVEFSQKVSFNELCNSFRAYASNRGVNVELSSVRSLISATVSGKLLFISCKNKDVLPRIFGYSKRIFFRCRQSKSFGRMEHARRPALEKGRYGRRFRAFRYFQRAQLRV